MNASTLLQTKTKSDFAFLNPVLNKTLKLSITFVLLGGGFIFNNAQAESLLDIYRIAQQKDATIQAAQQQKLAEQEKVPQARAGLLPQANFTYQKQEQTNAFGSTPYITVRPELFSLTITQPLFRWQAYQNYEQSKLLSIKSKLDYTAAEHALALKVAKAYFDILTAQDHLNTLAKQKQTISEQLEAAKRSFELGGNTITDQQEAQARFDLVMAQEIFANNNLLTANAALENLIGSPVPPLSSLKKNALPPTPEPATLETWVSAATSQSIAVQTSRINQEITQRDVSKTKAGHLPTVDLIASKIENNGVRFGQITTDTSTRTYGIQVNIPLFSGGATQSQVRESVALLEKAKANLLAAQRNAAQQAQQNFTNIQSGLAQIKALKTAEKSSQLALEANQLGYKVGVRINIDVLNAQQQLSNTQKDLAKATYDTLLAGLQLKATIGNLQESDLANLSALFQNAEQSVQK